jgi:hypothetical protein
MVNYANGKVYNIESISGEGNIYIFSTTKQYLSQPMDSHRYDFIGWQLGCKNYNKNLFIQYIRKIWYRQLSYSSAGILPCASKDELHASELKRIRSTQCVNKNIPGRTKQMYREEKREVTKEEMAAQVICKCGASLSHATLTRHLKTEKHKPMSQSFNFKLIRCIARFAFRPLLLNFPTQLV